MDRIQQLILAGETGIAGLRGFRLVLPQPSNQLIGRQRPAQMVPLNHVATVQRQRDFQCFVGN